MAEHAKKKVSILLDLCCEKGDGFGKRLVDRFAEANDVVQIGLAGLAIILPQAMGGDNYLGRSLTFVLAGGEESEAA
ncbi:hypothetical protein QFZ96_002235 [Paraburkholderia youngii]